MTPGQASAWRRARVAAVLWAVVLAVSFLLAGEWVVAALFIAVAGVGVHVLRRR